MKITTKVGLLYGWLAGLVVFVSLAGLQHQYRERRFVALSEEISAFQLDLERFSVSHRVGSYDPLIEIPQIDHHISFWRDAVSFYRVERGAVERIITHLTHYRQARSELESARRRVNQARSAVWDSVGALKSVTPALLRTVLAAGSDISPAIVGDLLRALALERENVLSAPTVAEMDIMEQNLNRLFLLLLYRADREQFVERARIGALESSMAILADLRRLERQRLDTYRRLYVAVAVVAVGGAIGLGFLASRYLRRFLSAHAMVMQRAVVPDGLFETRDELNELLQTLYRTLMQLRLEQERLRESERRQHDLAEQRALLLRELHHRTKNNLQVILSMLSLRRSAAAGMDQESMAAVPARVLTDLERIIHAMALAHEQLYESAEVARLDLARYLRDLTAHFFSGRTCGPRIAWHCDTSSAEVGADAAIVVGIVLHELCNNAIRHAFVQRSGGTVAVTLQSLPSDTLAIDVVDDGVGMEPDAGHTTGVGLLIAQSLVHGQLGGTLRQTGARVADSAVQTGTGWRIEFPRTLSTAAPGLPPGNSAPRSPLH